MLFGTRSQAHAYDPSDYMETMLIIICYKPKGNIIILLPFLELKSILSLLKQLDQVLIAIILFLMKGPICK